MKDRNRVCPVELAGGLDNTIRRWLQNPRKILGPYLHQGMTALDIGCGPGFFTVEMAKLVGTSGHVTACDLQEGMLEKMRVKIQDTELADRITLHKTGKNEIGIHERVDFILVFYMLHEVPGREAFLKDIRSLLKENGRVLIVEPNFHVSKSDFKETIKKAETAGFTAMQGPKVLMSRSIILAIAHDEDGHHAV